MFVDFSKVINYNKSRAANIYINAVKMYFFLIGVKLTTLNDAILPG